MVILSLYFGVKWVVIPSVKVFFISNFIIEIYLKGIEMKSKINLIAIIYTNLLFQYGYAETIVDVEMDTYKSALYFSEKWLATPKLYITLMLPTQLSFQLKEVTKSMKMTTKLLKRDAYFMLSTNLSRHNNDRYNQSEVLWFPFEKMYYDISCHALRSFDENNMTRRKNLLFFNGRNKNMDSFIKNCNIRFDSSIVAYYTSITLLIPSYSSKKCIKSTVFKVTYRKIL